MSLDSLSIFLVRIQAVDIVDWNHLLYIGQIISTAQGLLHLFFKKKIELINLLFIKSNNSTITVIFGSGFHR